MTGVGVVHRLNSPELTGVFAGAMTWAFVHPRWVFHGALVGFYAWCVITTGVHFVRGVQASDPQTLLNILDEDKPEVAITIFGTVIAVPYLIWSLGWFPILPSPNEAWMVADFVLIAIGGLVWFIVAGFTITLGVVGSGDLIRRSLGREGLDW